MGYFFSHALCDFNTRVVDAGLFSNAAGGLIGRCTKLPEQFGHTELNFDIAQSQQKVHSNVQINALLASGAKSVLQHSQLGFNASMSFLFLMYLMYWN